LPEELALTRGWAGKVRQELAPAHGRYEGALRTAFAATIAAAILLVLQVPMIAPGLFLIFIVSYDMPYLTFRRSVMEIVTQFAGVAVVLMLIQITGNDPMARVLGIAAFTFLSAFLLQACTLRVAAMNFGIFPVLTLSLWEYHLPSHLLVYLSLAPLATGAVAVGCKVAIEYLFTRRDPRRALHLEITARLDAMRELFTLYGKGATDNELKPAIAVVSRFAFAGQGKMLSLLNEVESAPEHEDSDAVVLPASIPTLARLLDLAAAFGRQNPGRIDDADRDQARKIAAGLEAVEAGSLDTWESQDYSRVGRDSGLLEKFGHALYNFGAISRREEMRRQEHLLKAPSQKVRQPWFKPDAWSNSEYLLYAAKLSFCATLCYVIYNALRWPGISTATLTVLVAGLSTTGATNQKMLFRIVGVLIGGVVFGIGCIVFVYPFADTLLPFLLSVGCVSFIAAWIARSAHLGYIGLQIAFSFYLTAFQEYAIPQGKLGEHAHINLAHKFAAPVIMTPGRDRVLGVLLALVVMWAIFHRIHPERAVEKMHRGLAQLLRVVAELLPLFGKGAPEQVAALREEAEAIVVEVRGLAETIPYELDEHVERDLELSEAIQNAISTTGTLLLHTAAQSPHIEDKHVPRSSTGALDGEIAEGLQEIAATLEAGMQGSEDLVAMPPDISPKKIGLATPKSSIGVIVAYSKLLKQCTAIRNSIY
jgi:multidrug resistance protein MdtO